jgi:hypothetical protein
MVQLARRRVFLLSDIEGSTSELSGQRSWLVTPVHHAVVEFVPSPIHE